MQPFNNQITNIDTNSSIISCIVPVYNVAVYLEACLASIARQTFADFECICVDDGSKDESGFIAERFCQKDRRFHLVRQPNQGLSAARNSGIKRANGRYVFFVDSDDFIHPETFAHCHKLAVNEGADLVCCDFQEMPESATLDDIPALLSCSQHMAANQPLASVADGNIPIRVSACVKLYATDLLRELRFDESVKLHEDTFFSLQVLDKAERLVFSDAKIYYYRTRRQSLMTTKRHKLSFVNLSNAMMQTRQLALDRGLSRQQTNRLIGEGGGLVFCMLAVEVALTRTLRSAAKPEEYETCLEVLRKLKKNGININYSIPLFLKIGMFVSYTLKKPAMFRIIAKAGVRSKNCCFNAAKIWSKIF